MLNCSQLILCVALCFLPVAVCHITVVMGSVSKATVSCTERHITEIFSTLSQTPGLPENSRYQSTSNYEAFQHKSINLIYFRVSRCYWMHDVRDLISFTWDSYKPTCCHLLEQELHSEHKLNVGSLNTQVIFDFWWLWLLFSFIWSFYSFIAWQIKAQ